MTRPIFAAENLSIGTPGGEAVLRDISLSVSSDEIVALIGESGSGKTTLSLSALGHIRPGLQVQGGRTLIDGADVLRMSPAELRKLRGRQVAYVAQSAAASFNPSIRLRKQVVEGAIVRGTFEPDQAFVAAENLFQVLDLPDPRTIGRRFPHQVSGGQLQRFMAAMGLIESPKLIVLDEPTSALDVTTQVEVLKAFKSAIRGRRTAALFVSHDLAVVAQIADRIAVMFHGEILEEGKTADILHRPQHAYTKQLLSAFRNLEAGPESVPVSVASARADEPILEARDIAVRFGNVVAVDHVSLAVKPSEIVAVVGESGSGKSTFALALSGLVPYEGDLKLNGQHTPALVKARSKAALRKVQMVFQMADTALNPRQTVGAILGRVIDVFLDLPRQQKQERIAELLRMVHLPETYATRRSSELSGGEKQRVNLARALAAEPEIVICDEITSALDTVIVRTIVSLIRSLREKIGVAFVFISHDLSTVSALADRVLVMHKGQIVETGATAAVLSDPQHLYTRLLVDSVPELRVGWLEEVSCGKNRSGGEKLPP